MKTIEITIHFVHAFSSSAPAHLTLTLLHSEWPKLHRVLAVLSAIGLNILSFKND